MYETLELEKGAGDNQIKMAYRRLVKFHRPDVYDGIAVEVVWRKEKLRKVVSSRFRLLMTYDQLLMDGEKRRQYVEGAI
ncbi:unnamed protein product [Rhodiola kirilowii]